MKLKMILLWAFTASLAFSAETSNWEGTFFWSKRKKQVENITAAFEKDGKDWKATFTFKWGGKDHIYTGTAKGNMKSGNLTGKINSDDKRVRSFTFKGKIKDGKFEGTHKETTKGRKKETGAMSLTLLEPEEEKK
ncbi:MAG: hypothetical protein HRT89_24525 [Lentisphaeria bacterium]|nr:hypothetical protein [Lentisphaeria bacterium]NQZ71223.1 hypothetical protein [Lentisphaeria bacterium]